MSKLLAFLGGAAEGFTEEVSKAEKSAKEEAMLRIKKLSENFEKTKEENKTLQNSLKAEEDWIKTTYADATPEQIAFLQSSPAALQALKKMKDPTRISLSDVIAIDANNESNAVISDRITALPEVADKVSSAIKSAMPAYRSGFGGFIDRIAEGAGDTAEKRYARMMGTDVQTMQALKPLQRPTQAGKFDMAKTVDPLGFTELKDKAQVELLDAENSKDPAKINAAKEKLTRVTVIEDFNKTKDKTESQIQSDLITEIQQKQAAGDKQGASLATALLRQRQALAKAPGSEGKTDADKISQANLIQVATRARATAIEGQLPPGTFITNVDAQGNVTTVLRDLKQGDLFRKGEAIGANAIIKEMTKPDGTPRSEMHKNAMMSAGIQFDDKGKAIRPVIPEVNKPAPAQPAPPSRGGPTPAPAATPAQPATTRPAVDANQARKDANDAIAKGADRATVAARFKQATGQEL